MREKRSSGATGVHSCREGEAFHQGTLVLKLNNNYNNRHFKSSPSSRLRPVERVLWCFYECTLCRPDTREPQWSHVHMLHPQSGPQADYRFWRVGQFEGLARHRGCFHDGIAERPARKKRGSKSHSDCHMSPEGETKLEVTRKGGGEGWKHESSVVNGWTVCSGGGVG